MTITALPTPPTRQDPSNFSARADAFMVALPTFVTETNATAVAADADAASALASKIDAAASATAANASANVTKWISGTTYSEGAVVWSPVNFFSYRRKVAGAGSTDPTADTTNWALVSGAGNVQTDLTQTLTNKTLSSTCVLQGNAATATKLSGDSTNWTTYGTIDNVIGQLAWKLYGNNHTIFDASAGTSPNGSAVNNTNPTGQWQPSRPTLMGWDGTATYGVRVDSARYADTSLVCTGNAATATTDNQHFGVGQSWQNVLGSRVFGTTYTNTTGRSIMVIAGVMLSAGGGVTFNVNGAALNYRKCNSNGTGIDLLHTIVVPHGSSYSVALDGGTVGSNFWSELRA